MLNALLSSKKYFYLLALVGFPAISAFNESENEQLKAININENIKLLAEVKNVENNKSLIEEYFPERKEKFSLMVSSWEEYAERKCKFHTYDSENTDAEFANFSSCMTNEYKELNTYLESVLSMP
ncbi:hypothetical protein [Vibrio coralliilyticus]|uniref:hypothetical protein n=1 Tax=Vibrio coralliilyticus TaxID=190893 RepID=UPI001560E7F5|nr:hypothetical protein [Vibrio coralliilyticus]NRF29830.1 hypothetical protein [Vibrio coralliilyticus]